MPLLAIMAACAISVTVLASPGARFGSAAWWLMLAPFALYAGWTTCALFVNIAEVAPRYGFDRFGLSPEAYGAASLAAAAALASLVMWLSRGQAVYPATIAWALVGILVAAQTRAYGPL
jgi:uncharacterized membrane protein